MRNPNISTTVAERLQLLRSRNGLVDERQLDFRCAVSGAAFAVIFARDNPDLRFGIARIEAAGQAGRTRSAGIASKRKTFSASEFDLSGFQCPHCGDARGFVVCGGCGGNVCNGRLQELPGGAERFACHDECGSQGPVEPGEKVSGSAGGDAAGQIGQDRRKALPPWRPKPALEQELKR